MDGLLLPTAGLIALVGALHSALGERFLIGPLCKRDDLPSLGAPGLAAQTLRFAWHLTTVAWLGLAALLVLGDRGALTPGSVLSVVAATAGFSGAIALLGSRGRHLAWTAFFLIAVAILVSSEAQAGPEAEIRVGVMSIEPADGAAHAGLALRFPIGGHWAVSGAYVSTIGETEFTTGPFQTVSLSQLGAHLEATERRDDWYGLVRFGAVYTDADFGSPTVSETAPAFGLEVGWKMLGVGWSHTTVDDRDVDAISFILRF